MLTIFLPPYPFRGMEAPYLWVFYKFLSEAKEPLNFLTGKSYLRPESYFIEQNRWEVEIDTYQKLKYTTPSDETIARHNFTLLDEELFKDLLELYENNPLAAFRSFLNERIPLLEAELEKALSDIHPEAIITWTNCPSLEAIAKSRNIPVIHSEIGPLREPLYRSTGYFDFSGVNGNTEAEDRYLKVIKELDDDLIDLENLRRFFTITPDTDQVFPGELLGLPLQVEDDSNLVAYGQGYDNQTLVAYAVLNEKTGNLLIRPHPGSLFTIKGHRFLVDDSSSSVEFIKKCGKLITINSSVGLEALLFGRSVVTLGDSSYKFITLSRNEKELLQRLSFYLFCYLAPFSEIYNTQYIRFRLKKPSELEILQWHLNAYGISINKKSTLSNMMLKGVEHYMEKITKQHNTALVEENEKLRHLVEEKSKESAQFSEKLEWQITHCQEIESQLHYSEMTLREAQQKERILIQELQSERTQVAKLVGSLSWRVTAPLRAGRRKLESLIIKLTAYKDKIKNIFTTIYHDPKVLYRALRHILKNGLKETIAHSHRALNHRYAYPTTTDIRLSKQETNYILTTHHCLFIAEQIKRNLEDAGFPSEIIFNEPISGFANSLHFVICPQIFKSLPGLYVAFQMEQSVSSRWFNESYLKILENSFAILDYSTINIKYLQEKGISLRQLYYTPISYISNYRELGNTQKEYDVLFYGDANNDRRKRYLAAIKKKYKLKIINNIFGEELYNEIVKARLVVNIHYYEGALLETTRIYECLSLGAMIVSESSSDIVETPQLQNLVDFVPVGDIDGMLERIDYWLDHPNERQQKIENTQNTLRNSPNLFSYYFNRFLLATDNISFDEFYRLAGHHIEFNNNYVCLGLPESTERRSDFEKDNTEGFQYFPGLRHNIGWIGCGLSYKFIIRKAQEQNFGEITICEDDVEFLPKWKERLDKIHNHLKSSKKPWDIFSGLIANLHTETRIKSIETFDEFELVHIDKMTSTVLNTYNSRVFPKILKWNENDRTPASNTIDRFIERQPDVDIITTTPFLVGHKEELSSTLWGFKNTQYRDMIAASAALLREKAAAYKVENQAGH